MTKEKGNVNEIDVDAYDSKGVKDVVDKPVSDFMDLLLGGVPLYGYPLAIYNYAIGKKRRARYFAIYSTIGLIALIMYLVFFSK